MKSQLWHRLKSDSTNIFCECQSLEVSLMNVLSCRRYFSKSAQGVGKATCQLQWANPFRQPRWTEGTSECCTLHETTARASWRAHMTRRCSLLKWCIWLLGPYVCLLACMSWYLRQKLGWNSNVRRGTLSSPPWLTRQWCLLRQSSLLAAFRRNARNVYLHCAQRFCCFINTETNSWGVPLPYWSGKLVGIFGTSGYCLE